MKQAVRNSGIVALVTLFVLSFSGAVLANDNKEKKESNIELKFIGNVERQPVFQLNLSNKESEEYYITITDMDGHVLYFDKVKGAKITKKFAINTEEVGDASLRFEIRSKSTNQKETYNINRTSNYVIESSVTKVN